MITMFDEIIEDQIKEFNADLMIAAYVFTIIASFVIWLTYYTYIPFDKQIVDYYHTLSLTLNEPLMTFMANGLDTAGMILIVLIGWIALNFLQGCCMAIDAIKEMRKE